MPHTRVLPLIAALCLLGAGCWSKPPAPPVTPDGPEYLPKQDLKAPSNAWGEYERASAATDSIEQQYAEEAFGREITLRIPASWKRENGVWRPEGSTVDHIRADYFSSPGTETEWSNQQELVDVHEVVHAEKKGETYVLMVNHPQLKATILKLFQVDTEHPNTGFFFVECRVAYDAPDRGDLWEACKAAVESATYHIK